MENYFNSLYQILTAIEYSSYTGEDIYDILDLKKLKITEIELDIIIFNILNEEYAVNRISSINTGLMKRINPDSLYNPQLTTKGYEYLEDNSKMKQAYRTLKELKEWIPGL